MRTIGIVVAALVLVNAALMSLRQSVSADRAALVDQASVLAQRADRARLKSEHGRALDALVTRARAHAEDPRDIGGLRDVLVGAERGLAVDRLSLDFRPEEQLPSGLGGARVHASLRGRFEAVYAYLQRIEAMFLPLSVDNLTLRGEAESVTLTVQWGARWPLAESEDETELSENQVSRLERWLARPAGPHSERDIFSFHEAIAPTPTAPVVRASEVSPEDDREREEPEPEAQLARPVLTGFVLARPELEPDVRRRVLAALRYEGETRLVMVGDTIGDYVVDRMEARDSVTLTRTDTGESIRLTLP